jgi:hypothetical protein
MSPELTVTVDGYPPAKAEATSMLGGGHPHLARVRALLPAAATPSSAMGDTLHAPRPRSVPSTPPLGERRFQRRSCPSRMSHPLNHILRPRGVLTGPSLDRTSPLQRGEVAPVRCSGRCFLFQVQLVKPSRSAARCESKRRKSGT